MVEKPDAPLGAHAIALELARLVAVAEGKMFNMPKSASAGGADRTYILDLYKECIKAVGSQRIG